MFVKTCGIVELLISDERVSLDVGKLIQKGRMEKKMSQKDLATVIYKLFFIFAWNVQKFAIYMITVKRCRCTS